LGLGTLGAEAHPPEHLLTELLQRIRGDANLVSAHGLSFLVMGEFAKG
jgi:hypothetical protein